MKSALEFNKIFILSGIKGDITKLDFQFLNLVCFKSDSAGFKTFLNDSVNIKRFEKILNESNVKAEECYAFVPKDLTLEVPNIWKLYMLLLAIFPSKVHLHSELNIQLYSTNSNDFLITTTTIFGKVSKITRLNDIHLLNYNSKLINNLNQLMPKVYNGINNVSYINDIVESFMYLVSMTILTECHS